MDINRNATSTINYGMFGASALALLGKMRTIQWLYGGLSSLWKIKPVLKGSAVKTSPNLQQHYLWTSTQIMLVEKGYLCLFSVGWKKSCTRFFLASWQAWETQHESLEQKIVHMVEFSMVCTVVSRDSWDGWFPGFLSHHVCALTISAPFTGVFPNWAKSTGSRRF